MILYAVQPVAESSRRGVILDQTIGGASSPIEWMESPIETSMLSGIKYKGKARYFVVAYRCVNCGRLELYAGRGV